MGVRILLAAVALVLAGALASVRCLHADATCGNNDCQTFQDAQGTWNYELTCSNVYECPETHNGFCSFPASCGAGSIVYTPVCAPDSTSVTWQYYCAATGVTKNKTILGPTCTSSAGGGGSEGDCPEGEIISCEDELGVLEPDCTCDYDTPIVLDTDGGGFHLSNVAGGVKFDLGATGTAEQVAWTAEGSTNAFLALDRNGDGVIDNGSELFGNVTPQPASPHPNGFLALAVYDQAANGGNGDGKIDSRDAIFSRLLLWVDSNHDGISEPGELHGLPELGIAAIYLNYRLSWQQDQYGNAFRYRAAVAPEPGVHPGPWAYDVILRTQ